MSESTPNCYKCKHRRNVPGDAHSACAYPGVSTDMFSFFEKNNRETAQKLNIQAESHGIKMGWFFWPVNFDPVWLLNCDGFTSKEAAHE